MIARVIVVAVPSLLAVSLFVWASGASAFLLLGITDIGDWPKEQVAALIIGAYIGAFLMAAVARIAVGHK